MTYPCAESVMGCVAMGLADSKGITGPGVSHVPKGWTDPCGATCAADGTCVRSYTYMPQSWENQTVAAVFPGFKNVFGNRMYDDKVTARPLRRSFPSCGTGFPVTCCIARAPEPPCCLPRLWQCVAAMHLRLSPFGVVPLSH